MRSVHEQLTAVLAAARPVPPLDVVLADAAGCVLAEDVHVDDDVPAVDLASCDGYAVRADDVAASGPGAGPGTTLPVVDDARVGSGPLRHVAGTAVLVASGAPVPRGADAVVPLEHTDRGRANVAVRRPVEPGENVRAAGSEASAGTVVLSRGARLGPRHLGLAASLGRRRLLVHPSPRVVVVTVGDELAEPGRREAGHGVVHDADGPALTAAVQEVGASAVRVGPVGDDRAALREVIGDQLVRADLLVIAGGLSSGPWDTVTDVLAPLGTVRFDQVAMTPGGRQGFGTVEDVPVLALPGLPVAAVVSFEVFVRPALRAMAGYGELFRPTVRAASTRAWGSPAGLRQLVPVRLSGSPTDGYVLTPVGDAEHPTLTDLASADALAVVSEDTRLVRAGDALACLLLEG
jgi:molybdopterin molybdotransferase